MYFGLTKQFFIIRKANQKRIITKKVTRNINLGIKVKLDTTKKKRMIHIIITDPNTIKKENRKSIIRQKHKMYKYFNRKLLQ